MEMEPEKRTTVVDDNIGDYSKQQLFFRLAVAYGDASRRLFDSMLEGSLAQSFCHAQAGHFLLDHAVELFLKGAILAANKPIDNTHHLDQLHNLYCKLYPKRIFRFTGDIAETVRHDTSSPHSKFPRYPIDTDGNLWGGYNAYTLETWKKEAESLCEDFGRLIPLIAPLPPPPSA